jgi:hypothetical protein
MKPTVTSNEIKIKIPRLDSLKSTVRISVCIYYFFYLNSVTDLSRHVYFNFLVDLPGLADRPCVECCLYLSIQFYTIHMDCRCLEK